jgi:hypothetical protein
MPLSQATQVYMQSQCATYDLEACEMFSAGYSGADNRPASSNIRRNISWVNLPV